MKLNQMQRYVLLDWLSRNIKGFLHLGVVYEYDNFCDGEIREWRVISDFGMAGKIWNSMDRIYITGCSPCEIGGHESKAWKEQQKKIDKWNEELTELIGIYSI